MAILASLADFSRSHCVSICSTLVPSTLVLTVIPIVLGLSQGQSWQLKGSYAAIAILNGLMVLHVASWLSIGVITPITFILLGLALTCLSVSTVVVWLTQRQFLPVMPMVSALQFIGYH